jgi:hypothetical protein
LLRCLEPEVSTAPRAKFLLCIDDTFNDESKAVGLAIGEFEVLPYRVTFHDHDGIHQVRVE